MKRNCAREKAKVDDKHSGAGVVRKTNPNQSKRKCRSFVGAQAHIPSNRAQARKERSPHSRATHHKDIMPLSSQLISHFCQ